MVKSDKPISFYLFPLLLGAVLTLLFIAINLSWQGRELPGLTFLGFLNSDQVTYSALFRALFESGNGILYASPHEIRDGYPAIFFYLPFFLLGWFWHLTGLSLPMVWMIFQVIFGLLMFFSLGLILHRFFVEKNLSAADIPATAGWYFYAVTLIFTGAGLSWLLALFRWLTASGSISFLDTFLAIEKNFHWWSLNIYRLSTFPLEIFHHLFFFLAVYFLLRARYSLMCLCLLILWLSNVFNAAELSAILSAFCVVEIIFYKNKRLLPYLLVIAGITFIFFLYYRVFLHQFPQGRSLYQQHAQFPMPPIPLSDYIPAYGLFFLVLPFCFLNRQLRAQIHQEPAMRLIVVWLIVSFLLINNYLFLPGAGIQPPHFTRGYFFLPAAIIVLRFLKILLEQEKLRRWAVAVLVSLFVFSLPDNIIYTYDLLVTPPHPGVLTIRNEKQAVIDFLNGLSDRTRHIFVLSNDRKLDILIPALTPHRSLLADIMATPFYDEKTYDAIEYFDNPQRSQFLQKYNIDTIIVSSVFQDEFNNRLKLPAMRLLMANTLWAVYDYQADAGP